MVVISHEPVRWEAQGGYDVVMIQSVQVFAVIQVPQHRLAILATTGAQATIRGNRHRVQITTVSGMIDLQLAVGQVPHFNHMVPAGRHNYWVRVIRWEPHARHPIIVTILLNRILAFCKRIPQFDGFIAGTRHNLAVIHGKCNAQHVLEREKTLSLLSSTTAILQCFVSTNKQVLFTAPYLPTVVCLSFVINSSVAARRC